MRVRIAVVQCGHVPIVSILASPNAPFHGAVLYFGVVVVRAPCTRRWLSVIPFIYVASGHLLVAGHGRRVNQLERNRRIHGRHFLVSRVAAYALRSSHSKLAKPFFRRPVLIGSKSPESRPPANHRFSTSGCIQTSHSCTPSVCRTSIFGRVSPGIKQKVSGNTVLRKTSA